jgi:hypothetical protein
MTDAKAFMTFIRRCSIFRSERLRAKIKVTLHKALISLVMTYACSAWDSVVKLQRLQNKVLYTIGNFTICTPFCDLHMVLNISYIQLHKKYAGKAEVIQNHEHKHVRSIVECDARHRKYKTL